MVNETLCLAAGVAAVALLGAVTFGPNLAAAAPAPAPSVVVQTYPVPAWWASTRAMQVTAQGLVHNFCRADVELLPQGVTARWDPTHSTPSGLYSWATVNQIIALTNAQADSIGCP